MVVVINGPEATAGLMSNWLRTKGVIVPIKEASITIEKIESDITNEMVFSCSKTKVPKNANVAAISPLRRDTNKTFFKRSVREVSIPDLSAKLCTINADD